jgi:hypothetical protein
MKKCLSVLLVICLLAALFTGCSNSKDNSPEASFVAPDNYVSVVQITINPTVNLYLDASDIILALEYVNEDAKECYSKVEKEIVGQKLEAAVDKVVATANSDGYFAKNNVLTIGVVESKAPEKTEAVLNAAQTFAESALADNSINAEVKFSDNAQQTTNQSDNTETGATNNNAESTGGQSETVYELQKNKEYEIFKLGETDNLITGFHIAFEDNGKYSYSQIPYMNDLLGTGDYRIYNGKNYYVAGGLGGEGNYTVQGNKIVMSGELALELTAIADNKLKVDTVGSGNFFKAGDVIQIFSNLPNVEVAK